MGGKTFIHIKASGMICNDKLLVITQIQDDNISIGSDEVIMVDQSGGIPLGIMVSEITI